MLMILISGFTAGPAVSGLGSPTVSPVTAALCASEPLPPWLPSADVLLGVVPRAAAGSHGDGDERAGDDGAHQHAAQCLDAVIQTHQSANDNHDHDGANTGSSEGMIISLIAPLVSMSTALGNPAWRCLP